MSKIIVLDPGHGGTNSSGVYDPGACGNGMREADLTLDIVTRTQSKLVPYDVDVRIGPRADSLAERAAFANNLKADFLCAIHINAGGGTGFESYIYDNAPGTSGQLQNIIHSEIMAYLVTLGVANRGKKSANFAVLRETNMPAVLLENLFIDNTQDANLLKDNDFMDGLANAIAWALVVALGLKLKQVAPIPPEPAPDPCANCQKCNDLEAEKNRLFAENNSQRQILKQVGIMTGKYVLNA
jgi:N-acetylmuramoyl-L-alanine amidase